MQAAHFSHLLEGLRALASRVGVALALGTDGLVHAGPWIVAVPAILMLLPATLVVATVLMAGGVASSCGRGDCHQDHQGQNQGCSDGAVHGGRSEKVGSWWARLGCACALGVGVARGVEGRGSKGTTAGHCVSKKETFEIQAGVMEQSATAGAVWQTGNCHHTLLMFAMIWKGTAFNSSTRDGILLAGACDKHPVCGTETAPACYLLCLAKGCGRAGGMKPQKMQVFIAKKMPRLTL